MLFGFRMLMYKSWGDKIVKPCSLINLSSNHVLDDRSKEWSSHCWVTFSLLLHFTWLIWVYLNFTLIHLIHHWKPLLIAILYMSVTALKHVFNIHKLIFFSIALLSGVSVVGGFYCCSYSCVCGDRSLLQHYEALTRNEYQHSVVSACLGFCSVSFSVLLNSPYLFQTIYIILQFV